MAKKKGKKHPVSGLTDVQERQKLKGALRNMWRKSSRFNHIKKVRFPHPDKSSRCKYAVRCTGCGRVYGMSEQVSYVAKTGRKRRRRTGAYHVDHICETGLPPVNDIVKDLGTYAERLIHTKLRILCVDCHLAVTIAQAKQRHSK